MRKIAICLSYTLAGLLAAVFYGIGEKEDSLMTAAGSAATAAENGGIETFALVLAIIVAIAVVVLIALLLPSVLKLRRHK